MRLLVAAALALILLPATTRADSTSSTTWNGKTVTCIVRGNASSTSISKSADNAQCTIKVSVDGKDVELRLTDKELVSGRDRVPLKDYKEVEVLLDGPKFRVKVDGQQVLPKPEKKSGPA